ncbi:hypothetical protein BDV19DRAFT_205344 [Aspergillus venezuelensis]
MNLLCSFLGFLLALTRLELYFSPLGSHWAILIPFLGTSNRRRELSAAFVMGVLARRFSVGFKIDQRGFFLRTGTALVFLTVIRSCTLHLFRQSLLSVPSVCNGPDGVAAPLTSNTTTLRLL